MNITKASQTLKKLSKSKQGKNKQNIKVLQIRAARKALNQRE